MITNDSNDRSDGIYRLRDKTSKSLMTSAILAVGYIIIQWQLRKGRQGRSAH